MLYAASHTWTDFNPRSPCGERPGDPGAVSVTIAFQSTLSLRRATGQLRRLFIDLCISIHALLAESDFSRVQKAHRRRYFNPRSPCGERPQSYGGRRFRVHISIHALLAESDRCIEERRGVYVNFNPRSPCGERPEGAVTVIVAEKFQSTLSLRRATHAIFLDGEEIPISIHALLAESDSGSRRALTCKIRFQSTLSLRRATVRYFCVVRAKEFQSTLSLRRATANTTKLALSFLSKVPI